MILFWDSRKSASLVSVPETSVDKDCKMVLSHDNIWATGQLIVMYTIAKSI